MPRKLASRPPSYRLKIVRGRRIAYTRLRCVETRRVRDIHLGPYDAAETRERYLRELSAWESRGRRLPDIPERVPRDDGPTVSQILGAFLDNAVSDYSPGERANFGAVIRIVRAMFGSTPALAFGPNALRLVRDEMIRGAPEAQRQRRPWCRTQVNAGVGRVRKVWRWAVSRELLPASTYEALRTVEALKRGAAREGRKVRPATVAHVEAVAAMASPQVAAMIRLQRLTGARPGEVCAMRACDLDVTSSPWTYRPAHHKGEHRERDRLIYIGPQAQAIVESFLANRATDAYLFDPREIPHAAPKGQRRRPNQKLKPRKTGRVVHEKYSVDAYRRAIDRLCTTAGVPKWSPHQLRHLAATEIRRRFGLEAAQILLGHSSALVTEAVYAERDENKAREIVRVIG